MRCSGRTAQSGGAPALRDRRIRARTGTAVDEREDASPGDIGRAELAAPSRGIDSGMPCTYKPATLGPPVRRSFDCALTGPATLLLTSRQIQEGPHTAVSNK